MRGDSRPNACAGCEDGSLHVWDTRSGERLMQLPSAHATRIRGLVIVPDTDSSDSRSQQTGSVGGSHLALRVATAASDGVLRLWDMSNCQAAVDRWATFNCTLACRGTEVSEPSSFSAQKTHKQEQA